MLTWRELPALPQPLGGQFVGVIDGKLIAAGGTYWQGKPWSGGTKYWADTVYALSPGEAHWKMIGRLPEQLAYGAAVSLDGGMLLIGGQSARETHGRVWRLSLKNGSPVVERMAPLPCACGWMSAAVLDGVVYVAAGGEGWPGATKALRSFWKLEDGKWSQLDAWPGPARFFAPMTAAGGSLYMGGGTDLQDGKRVFLKDAYRYDPAKGWSRITDLPTALQGGFAAGTPEGHPLILGGNDGAWADRESHPDHPGFQREVFEYDPSKQRWIELGRMPASLVTSGLALWNGEFVIAGGEDRPGSRSARVIAARLPATK